VGYRPGLFLLLLLLAASSPAAVLTGDWHFDEYGWRGFANELNDFSGNNRHGRASEIIDYTPDGALCGAADLTRSSASDYFSLNRDAINGRFDFSLSIWGKMPSTVNQSQALFSAATSNSSNELLLYFNRQETRLELHFNSNIIGVLNNYFPNDDAWHNYIWVRSQNNHCLLIDGQFLGCVNPNDNSRVDVDVNGLVVGQDQDSVNGGFDGFEDWDGYVDELLIFDGALSTGEAQSIYSNYVNGQNWDGTARNCGVPNPVANYRFDQCDWQGGRDVADSSGNGLDGFALNGVISTIDGQVCGLAEFDGVDDYIAIPDDYRLDIRNELTVTTWVYAQAQASELKTILSKDTNYEFHLNNQGQIFWWWFDDAGNNRTLTSNQSLSLNQWHHVAIAYRNGIQRIYLDGNVVAESNFTGVLVNNDNELQLGQDQGIGGRYLEGALDEVKVFEKYLSQELISDIFTNEAAGRNYDGALRPCNCTEPPRTDHYEVSHSGSMVSCMASDITFTAHDASNAPVDAMDAEILITISSGKGEWLSVVSGSGVLTNLGNGQARYRFPDNGETSVTFQFAYPDLVGASETINFDVSDGIKTDRRNSADSEDQNLTISESGLIFDVPDTESCLASSQVTVRAVRSSDQAMVCGAAISGARNASLLFEYVSPNTGNQSMIFESGGQSTTLQNGTSASRTLNFNANGEAQFTAEYSDAGQVKLSLSVEGEYATLEGSDTWVAYPARLNVTAKTPSGTLLNNPSVASGATWPAGESFELSVEAMCANGSITENYQPAQAELSAVYQSPTIASGGAQGILSTQSGNLAVTDQPLWLSIASGFANGRWVDAGAHFSEVGVTVVSAQDGNYFGHSIAESSRVVGRFTPAFFDLSSSGPEFSSECGLDRFNYLGKWVVSDQPVELNVVAKNAQGQTTSNYGANFWKLSAAASDRGYQDSSGVASAVLEEQLTVGDWLSTDQNYDGEGGLSIYADQVRYQKGVTPQVPFAGDVSLLFSAADLTDGEGVCYKVDSDNDGLWSDEACASFTISNIDLHEQHFGRLRVDNAYGPETEWVPLNWLVEYYTSAGFVVNANDSCSVFQASQMSFVDQEGSLAASGSINQRYAYPDVDFRVEQGDAGLELSSGQQAGAQGVVQLSVDLSALEHLRFDYDGDGVDENPSATVTFGQYRNDDRVIFQRQY
jgi:MSHA biogenesis protein MshQ